MAIVIQIELDERGNIANLKKLERELENVGASGKKGTQGINYLDNAIDKAAKRFLTLGAAVYAFKQGLDVAITQGKAFYQTAENFETMRITLDQLTKGRGAEWFEQLNKWALKMPINTQAAVEGFIRMRAMGLEPTIKQMTTIMDATAALGMRSDIFDGIVLAMGQIATKGQLMSQELRQLAERGIPAYEILQQKLGITGRELETTNHQAIEANVALKALFEGMEERFGGLSKQIMYESGKGIREQLIGNWMEFQRVMMEPGPYDFVKRQMQDIADGVGNMAASVAAANNKAKTIAYMQSIGMRPEGANWDIVGKYEYTPEQIALGAQLRYQSEEHMRQYKKRMEELNAKNEAMSPNNKKQVTPLFEADEKYFKARAKRWEEENKRYVEMDKKYHGIRTQTAEQAENEKYLYFENLFAEFEQKDLTLREENLEKARQAAESYWNDQQRKAEQYRDNIVYIGETWAAVFERAAFAGGSFVDNMISELKRLAASTAIRGVTTGVISMLMGNTFGFGVGSYLSSIPGIGKLFGGGSSTPYETYTRGFALGGYTGTTGGIVHPHEYVNNQRTVDYWGVGIFEMLGKIAKSGGTNNYVINNNISPAERTEMMGMSDDAFIERFNRLASSRKIKVA